MKTTLIASIFALAFGFWAAPRQAAPADFRVRFVSSNRILAEANEPKAQVAHIQAMQQQKNAELREKQQLLESTRQQLAAATDAELRTKLQQQELQERTDLERATAQAQSELQSAQRTMQAGLQAKLKTILDDLLKDQNVSLVLNAESGVVWSGPGIDITPAVIERWNAKATAGSDKSGS